MRRSHHLAIGLFALASLALGAGCAGRSRRADPVPLNAEVLTTRVTIRTDEPGAVVELAANEAGWPTDVSEVFRRGVRRLPSSPYNAPPLFQLVGTTPYTVELPVAVRVDDRVVELYRWVRARITVEGRPPFESNLGIVGIEGQRSYAIDLAVRAPDEGGTRPRSAVASQRAHPEDDLAVR